MGGTLGSMCELVSGGWMTNYEPTDEVERYRISLVLKDPRARIPLFSFMGEGSVETGWRGVLFGDDDRVDLAGDQAQAFRGYLDLLSEFLGVTIGPPVPHVSDLHGRKYRCTACGKNVPPNRPTCLYCGGAIEEVA